MCYNIRPVCDILRVAWLEGFRRFEFGRSSGDAGTYRFKRQWGAREEPLFLYTIPIARRRSPTISSVPKGTVLLANVWQRLPLAVTRRLGPHIRKYLVQ